MFNWLSYYEFNDNNSEFENQAKDYFKKREFSYTIKLENDEEIYNRY